ncbi:MAG: hypothetical protein V1802_03040 [Candidatus Aenigmatarchaeota archaeon]
MVYITPLELCLETDLPKIGMPFEEKRILIHEAGLEGYLSHQSLSQKLRKEIKGVDDLEKSSIDWSAHYIVFRTTGTNSAGLTLSYYICPSEENKSLFKSITDYDAFEDIIDGILRERSFLYETVDIYPDTHKYPPEMTDEDGREMIGIMNNEYEDPLKFVEEMVKVSGKSLRRDKRWKKRLLITFYSDKVEISLGSDVPENIFVGINSPINDAPLISQKICDYLRQSK